MREMKTTFWSDFSIADKFGVNAIRDTYKRAVYWKDNIEHIAELYCVLNWKLWEHYENCNMDFAELYDELWNKLGDFVYNSGCYNKDELRIFFEITD